VPCSAPGSTPPDAPASRGISVFGTRCRAWPRGSHRVRMTELAMPLRQRYLTSHGHGNRDLARTGARIESTSAAPAGHQPVARRGTRARHAKLGDTPDEATIDRGTVLPAAGCRISSGCRLPN
jgi:hypothetical protein